MELKLVRKYKKEKYTIGKLYVDGRTSVMCLKTRTEV